MNASLRCQTGTLIGAWIGLLFLSIMVTPDTVWSLERSLIASKVSLSSVLETRSFLAMKRNNKLIGFIGKSEEGEVVSRSFLAAMEE